MQIQLPPMPPVHVTFVTPEPLFYTQWDFWVSFFTFALAVMTGWLAWETRALRRDSKGAAEGAQKSADAAQKTIEMSEKHFAIANRAWITLAEIEIKQRRPDQLPHFAVTTIENGGNSPAVGISSAQWWKVLPELPNPPDYYGVVPEPRGAIGPRLNGRVPVGFSYTREETMSLQAGTLKIYVYGFVRYEDVSGGKRETRWAFEYQRETGQFAALSFHNDVT